MNTPLDLLLNAIDSLSEDEIQAYQADLDSKDLQTAEDVYAQQRLHHIQAFRKARMEQSSGEIIKSILDHTALSLRKKIPAHRADVLVILAWTARIDDKTGCAGNLTMLNPAFMGVIENHFEGDLRDELGIDPDELNDYNRLKDIKLRNFLMAMADNSCKSQVEEFLNALDRLIQQPANVQLGARIQHEYQITPSEKSIMIGIVKSETGGIRLRFCSPGKQWYDFVAVLQLSPETTGSNFKVADLRPEHIFGIQGVCIPVDDRRNEYNEKLRQTIKAAISAVMSRNMSHNIGSHVLAKLCKLPKYVAQDMNRFLEYLQVRIELIADISTGEGGLFSNKLFSKEVLNYFFPKSDGDNMDYPKYLLDHISGSKDFDMSNLQIVHPHEDAMVAIPNDLLGSQAIYVILENLIRNAIKHCNTYNHSLRQHDLRLKIDIQPSAQFEEYYEVSIMDNLGKYNLSARSGIQGGASDDTTYKEYNLASIINEKLTRTVLDSNNKLREGDWGLLEMKICAAYLRQMPLERIDVLPTMGTHGCHLEYELDGKPRKEPVLLEAILRGNQCSEDQSPYDFGFRFHLLRPKLAIIYLVAQECIMEELRGLESFGVELKCMTPHDVGVVIPQSSHRFRVVIDPYFCCKEGLRQNQRTILLRSQDHIEAFCTEIYEALSLPNTTDVMHRLQIGFMDAYLKGMSVKPRRITILANPKKFPESLDPEDVVFEYHGLYLKWNDPFRNPTFRPFYFETFFSSSRTNLFAKQYEKSPPGSLARHRLELEMLESAATGIAILDERIQENTDVTDVYSLNKQEILRRSNVFIPSRKEVDLYQKGYQLSDGATTDTRVIIQEWISKTNKHFKLQFLIVHLTIIEKLGFAPKAWVDAMEAEFDLRVIVISGRGLPSNLPDHIYFLPFSVINHYVVSFPSKYALVNLLRSVRPILRRSSSL